MLPRPFLWIFSASLAAPAAAGFAPSEQGRRVVVAAAAPAALEAACEALRCTDADDGREAVLLLWQEPPGIHVERMWSDAQVEAWQRDRVKTLEPLARERLRAHRLRARITCRVFPAARLADVLAELRADVVVVPRPHDVSPPAGDDWWNLQQALRYVPGNVIVA